MDGGSDNLETLLTAEQIAVRVREMAAEIAADYAGSNVLLVGVLKGAFVFLSDLARALPGEFEIDFLQVASYGDSQVSSGVAQIRKDLDTSLEGRDVLLVDDIVDSGTTLNHLRQLFAVRKPKSLKVASLLSKQAARGAPRTVEYVGFEIPDRFVVGYGLDYAERFRNLPHIAILREG